MCLRVIKETSQCGPDILSDDDKREFKALKSTKYQFGLVISDQTTKRKATKSSKSVARSEHVGFCFFCLTQTPRGTHVWQIRPTITGSVCGTPDRLHVTWLSSRTTSYAPVTTAMPRGCSPPPPFKTVDLAHPPLYTQKHRQPPLLYLHLPKKNTNIYDWTPKSFLYLQKKAGLWYLMGFYAVSGALLCLMLGRKLWLAPFFWSTEKYLPLGGLWWNFVQAFMALREWTIRIFLIPWLHLQSHMLWNIHV